MPDFAITTDVPTRLIIWEHLGMLSDPKYASKWEKKKTGYAEQGILESYDGPNGLLLVMDDRGGVRSGNGKLRSLKPSVPPSASGHVPPPGEAYLGRRLARMPHGQAG
ncbi:hypothetical protein ACFWF9_00330 [Streptomyces roseolus]|uniref:hypothetical protein n=1 Tax=Streptomyces roseolus TaxID=67358 RepID=UPI00364FCEC6